MFAQSVGVKRLYFTLYTILAYNFAKLISIWEQENQIIIILDTEEGKAFQTLFIQDVDVVNGELVYFRKSIDNQKITISIPHQEKIEIIDLHKYSQEDDEIMLRFHLDRI